MPKIQLLPEDVANQVAAGEIVERPASIVKELVENSVDAGAKRITVEFSRGGAELIRISDDGCGMEREDAILSLQRHATSKIRTAADLASVVTMGFRGEALPSIASVSRFRMATRVVGADAGTEILVTGGKVDSVADCGDAPGTSIEVKTLFFNLPARKKFMRGELTETSHIIRVMEGLAIAHPSVTMVLVRDGKTLWRAAAAKDASVRLSDVFGADFLKRLVKLEAFEEDGIKISGHLARPGEGRPDREQQFVVLNGRNVDCPAIYQSLREAYAGSIPRGKNPLAILTLTLDPLSFDCNVHPAKREVRLHKPDAIKRAVFRVAQQMLDSLAQGTAPVESHREPLVESPVQVGAKVFVVAKEVAVKKNTDEVPFHDTIVERPALVVPDVRVPHPAAFLPPRQNDSGIGRGAAKEDAFQVVGEMGGRWLVLQGDDGMVLLDTCKASERIIFEAMAKECEGGNPPAQQLLIPEVIEFPLKDFAWISENLDVLSQAGFVLEPFGGSTFNVAAIPTRLQDTDIRNMLLELCASLRASGTLASRSHILDSLIVSVSIIAGTKGFSYSPDNARRLVRELLGCKTPYSSPRGHPTMIQWSFSELERKFGGGKMKG